MRYPIDFIGITQGHHQGKCIDMGWNEEHGGKNVDILACADGKVTKIENQKEGGICLYIDYNNGIVSQYAHLSETLVNVGDNVKMAQKVGKMGNTGNASQGNHLHLALGTSIKDITDGKSSIDPLTTLEVYDNQVVAKSNKFKLIKHVEKQKEFPKTMVVNTPNNEVLNCRIGAGQQFAIAKFSENVTTKIKSYKKGSLVQYPKNERLTIYEITSNGWAKGVRGYMASNFLKDA